MTTKQITNKSNAQLIGIALGTLSCLNSYADLCPLHKQWLQELTQVVKQLDKNIL